MLKFVFSTLVCLLCITYINAQNNVGIGTNTPDPSAKLDISSSNMGLLIPRVSLSNVSTWGLASGTGTNGMIVYNTNASVTGGLGTGFYFWNGSAWTKLANGPEKVQNGLSLATTAPNASASDPYIELGGNLVRNTTVAQAANTLAFTTTVSNGFSVDGTTLSVDGANDRVGIGTSAPGQKLEVIGNISLPNNVGNYSIYTWAPSDANWRIGMNDVNANVGFSRSLATSHVQYLSYASGAGQGFAVGDKVSGLSSFEVTGSGSSYNAYFRGSVGIGVNPAHKLTIAGTGSVFGVDNQANFQAKNSAGTYENYFWPRWNDNIMYMNYGSGGFNLRNNSSATAMFFDNDLSIDIKRGVLFNCDDCGSTSTIDGTGNWGDLIIQGRVLSTNSNLHLSPPGGSKVIINSTYRSAGGTTGTTGLDIEDGGIRMRKNYAYIQRYAYTTSSSGVDGGWTYDLGLWDFCSLAHFGFKNNASSTDEDDDAQCAVYPNGAGAGETTNYDYYFTEQFNSKRRWYMYMEAYDDTNGITCAANCINLE